MVLYLTRHGETDWNKDGRIQGQKDIPLNENGIKEAYELKENVKDIPFDFIVSSPLKRAYKTASIVNEDRHLPLSIDDRIKEMNYGDLEGKKRDEELNFFRGAILKRYPHGEGYKDTIARIYSFLNELYSNHKDKTILVVAHTGISRIFVSYFQDMTNNEFLSFHLKNCEVIRLEKK